VPEFVQPTTWNLSNAAEGLQVNYSADGLYFHQGSTIQNFPPSEIRLVEVPDLGTLVSVTILLTIDSGSTTFTLLLPQVNLPGPPAQPVAVPVSADGITTAHRFSVLPPLQHGQQEFYTVIPLQGTAS
jgi:hypothetical protein